MPPATRELLTDVASADSGRSMRAGGMPPATLAVGFEDVGGLDRSMRAGGMPPATRERYEHVDAPGLGRSMRAGGMPPATR